MTPNLTHLALHVRDLEAFNPGAHLIVKMSTSLSAQEIDVTQDIIGNDGDVRDPEFSPDGSKLVFALHKKNNPNEAIAPVMVRKGTRIEFYKTTFSP